MFRSLLFAFLFLSLFSCLEEKVCSENDRSCNFGAYLIGSIDLNPGIYLFATSGTFTGNIASYGPTFEASTHNICYAERAVVSLLSTGCLNVHPVVSTSSTLAVADFANAYKFSDTELKVFGPKGKLFAASWSDAIGGTTLSTLSEAEVTSEEYWTFTTAEGTYNTADNCIDGTNNGAAGAVGNPLVTGTGWIFDSAPGCGESKKVLCFCY